MHSTKKLSIVLVLLCCLFSSVVQAQFEASIPVIDMNDYYVPSRRIIFVNGLADALERVGFVAVINSRIDQQVMDKAYATAQNFFSQSLTAKMLAREPKLCGQRGYVLSETAKGQQAKDFKEFYHIAREYPADIRAKYGYVENIWPLSNEFKPAMLDFMQQLDTYANVIAEALAESIGENPDFFTSMINEGNTLMRVIHYPANPPQNLVWAAAHTDIDLFTILPRATADGLQVLNDQGKWVDVRVPDNAIIINAGDMLQNITNGLYKSSVHRVVSKNGNTERYSIVTFIHPRPNDQMDPLPKCIKLVGMRRFANATAKELLQERLIDLGLHTPEMLHEFAKSGVMERLIQVNRASPAAIHALCEANLANPIIKDELARIDKKPH